MQKHSELPWHVDPHRQLRIATENNDTVANTGCDSSRREQWEPNAALIVRAVNAHADLVAAVSGMLSIYDSYDQNINGTEIVKIARVALAKAKA